MDTQLDLDLIMSFVHTMFDEDFDMTRICRLALGEKITGVFLKKESRSILLYLNTILEDPVSSTKAWEEMQTIILRLEILLTMAKWTRMNTEDFLSSVRFSKPVHTPQRINFLGVDKGFKQYIAYLVKEQLHLSQCYEKLPIDSVLIQNVKLDIPMYTLPDHYQGLLNLYLQGKCNSCCKTAHNGATCLICGDIICSGENYQLYGHANRSHGTRCIFFWTF